MTLYYDFKNLLRDKGIVTDSDTIILGVSGGSDSVALFRLFVQLREDIRMHLVVAHVNYHTRGKDSDADASFVRALVKKFDVPCEVLSVRVPRARKQNFEQWARETRYTFFQKCAQKHGARWIAVAHTEDDKAETVLLHLLKGTGLSGLAALKMQEGNILRPLVGISKDALRTYLQQLRQPFRIDRTNRDATFTRNRIRHRLLPYLSRHFNPNIVAALARFSSSAEGVEAFLQYEAQRCVAESVTFTKNRARIVQKTFLQYPELLQREILHAVFQHFGFMEPLSFRHYQQVARVVSQKVGNKHKEVTKNLKVSLKDGVISVEKRPF